LLSEEEARPFLTPGQLVPVEGGRRINIVCRGQGSPTVILEAGAANYSLSWARVFGPIATFTRVCAYDRAGYWFSDPNDRPSTAANIVDDLHRTLTGAGIKPPYVMVGHSAGGLYATLYADLHLEEVAGMVLADPEPATWRGDMQRFLTAADHTMWDKQNADFRALAADCATLARAHDVEAVKARQCPCGPPAAAAAPSILARAVAYCATPSQYEAVLAEDAAVNTRDGPSPIDRTEIAAARPFGSLPLTVLMAANGAGEPVSQDANVGVIMSWRADALVLSSRSTRGKTMIVQRTNHAIPLLRPDAIVAAVREVVQAARAAPAH
jgi:pimeloyl-ACP methyl ester carboxylesterase